MDFFFQILWSSQNIGTLITSQICLCCLVTSKKTKYQKVRISIYWLSDRLLYDDSKSRSSWLKFKHPLSVRRHFWFILKTATAARLVRMQFQIHSYIHHCQEESGRENNGFYCFMVLQFVSNSMR